jgi:NAD(P)-dependent dehydrogenase (short-subunit alcohol dehydrogenase family)
MTVPTWPNAKRDLGAFDLTGKRALVVGAADGAGRAVALAFAEAGCDLAVTTATPAADEALMLRKTAREARDLGRSVIEQSIDASSGQGAQVMVRQVAKEMGGIDIVVNAPRGQYFPAKPATSTSDADWAGVIGQNLSATFFVCRAAAKEMLKSEPSDGRTRGRIINVASVLGDRGLVNAAAYCAAQGGILNLTRALSQEWANDGITVNAIALGWLEGAPALGDADPATNKAVRFIPMKRTGQADEVAPLALYLASDASSYVSGQVLYVDGGLSVHL